MFTSGQEVEITVKQRDIALDAKSEFKYTVLNGVIQRSAHYDPPETIRLFTANPNFPVSVVAIKNIIEVEGKCVNFEKSDNQTWEVTGSKGDSYTVTRMGRDYRCTCKGFQFNKRCTHIAKIAK